MSTRTHARISLTGVLTLVLGLVMSALAPSAIAQQAPGEVAGTVTSQHSGGPLVGVTVDFSVVEGGSSQLVASAVTDAEGRYTATVPVGTYRVEIREPGRMLPTVSLTREVTASGVLDLVLDDSVTELYGQVTAAGVPIRATIELQVKTPTPFPVTVVSTTTDAQGNYRLSNLGVGEYYVLATPEDPRYAAQYYPGVATWQEAQKVATPRAEPLDFDLSPLPSSESSIRGRVTAEGQPLEGVTALLGLYREDAQGRRQAVPGFIKFPGSGGNYVIENLSPGTYFVSASQYGGDQYSPTFFRDAVSINDAEPIVLDGTAADVAVADLDLKAAPTPTPTPTVTPTPTDTPTPTVTPTPTPTPWWRQICSAPPTGPSWYQVLVRWACRTVQPLRG
ncbi:MSCRAMM family protein [Nocardioides houyundeii]|uniref:MSCRAMM family protein n=1 Tax=Nocardioides houyundeii TaxID=2045452 RepID=UPI000DF315F4|nr:carboxypeptidase-like regulatory domain-containing protein [Nocardioides houyundeii]